MRLFSSFIFSCCNAFFVNNSFVVCYFHVVADTKITSLKELPLTWQQLGVNRLGLMCLVYRFDSKTFPFKPNGKSKEM